MKRFFRISRPSTLVIESFALLGTSNEMAQNSVWNSVWSLTNPPKSPNDQSGGVILFDGRRKPWA